MARNGKHGRLRLRDLIATVALCLFIFRAIGGVAMVGIAPVALEGEPARQVVLQHEQHCENYTSGTNAPQKKNHDACCALCMSAARELADFGVRVATEILDFRPRRVAVAIPLVTNDPAPIKPAGLAASWSATSPPRG